MIILYFSFVVCSRAKEMSEWCRRSNTASLNSWQVTGGWALFSTWFGWFANTLSDWLPLLRIQDKLLGRWYAITKSAQILIRNWFSFLFLLMFLSQRILLYLSVTEEKKQTVFYCLRPYKPIGTYIFKRSLVHDCFSTLSSDLDYWGIRNYIVTPSTSSAIS